MDIDTLRDNLLELRGKMTDEQVKYARDWFEEEVRRLSEGE